MNSKLARTALSLGLIVAVGHVAAAPQFSATPVDPGTGLPFTEAQLQASNSFAGAALLQGKLVAGSIRHQNLEELPVGQAPAGGLAVGFKAGDGSVRQAVLSGGGRVANDPFTTGENGDEFLGRFNTTLGTADPAVAQYWESSETFSIEFTDGTTFDAFGFFGTDFGDFLGTITLDLLTLGDNGLTTAHTHTVTFGQAGAATDNAAGNGTLQFVGFYDPDLRYSGVRFTIGQTSGSDDFLGFDDFFIGDYQRRTDVPEPGSLALVGLSLLGMAATRRRRV